MLGVSARDTAVELTFSPFGSLGGRIRNRRQLRTSGIFGRLCLVLFCTICVTRVYWSNSTGAGSCFTVSAEQTGASSTSSSVAAGGDLDDVNDQACLAPNNDPIVNENDKHNNEKNQDPPSQQSSASSVRPKYPCTDDFLPNYWQDRPVPGFHIACFFHHNQTVLIYRQGVATDFISTEENRTFSSTWQELQTNVLEAELQLVAHPSNFQPYALFTPQGQRIVNGDYTEQKDDEKNSATRMVPRLFRIGCVLIYEGGQFLWPGVRIGFQRHNVSLTLPSLWYHDDGGEQEEKEEASVRHLSHTAASPSPPQLVTITTLSLQPLVVSIQGFLTNDECTYIQQQAEPTMQYSDVVLMDHDKGRPASDFRTSQSTFLQSRSNRQQGDNDDVLGQLEDRVAQLSRIPKTHQEFVQVLRYGYNEKYDAHTDYFDVGMYQQDPSTLQLIGHGRRNRLATVFWYLSNVTAGGETAFPATFRKGRKLACSSSTSEGLKVKPERGKVIIFYSLLMSGKSDPNSVHQACPVLEGIKWAANKWIWNEPMGYIEP